MASTNLLQWNSAQQNQESDTQYAADSLRTGGAGLDGTFPSPTANKLFYQLSTFVSAFGLMLAAKGISTSDVDINQLATALAAVQTSADIRGLLTVVNYSASPVFNASISTGFEIVLGGNVTASTLTGVASGDEITFVIVNPSTYTFVWPTNVLGAGTVQPNATFIQSFKVLTDLSVRPKTPPTLT